VAHALLQVREEVRTILRDFPADRLWERHGGVASVGFHLQHISGVIDRLFTYARGESLSDEQRRALQNEGHPGDGRRGVDDLLNALDAQIDTAVSYLRAVQPESLTEVRLVGQKRLPSTMLGLLFHAAEHAQRHLGQLLVTARVVAADSGAEGKA
jgi:uncharacterized damage-inducible protein DinB